MWTGLYISIMAHRPIRPKKEINIPWKQPGLHTGTSTNNSAFSTPQLPALVLGLSPLALELDTDRPAVLFASGLLLLPLACVLLTTSWATSSTNIFVSPSNSTFGPCMLAREESNGA